MTRRAMLVTSAVCPAVLVNSCLSSQSAPSRVGRTREESLRRAAAYLWAQQAADGGWHSGTYGLLRSGQSLTPFVLDALLQVPQDIRRAPIDAAKRAFTFLRRHDRAGVIGLADPSVPDYPNYATALAVQALCRAKPPCWQQTVATSVGYLRAQQFTEDTGWHRKHAAYGAWGMGGAPRPYPDAGHVDLSMTRHVLQALSMAGVPSSDPVMKRARAFIERCQNFDTTRAGGGDGGFFFSTVVLDANKAGHDGDRHRSYGTATADGILALLATGRTRSDTRIQAAQHWLMSHHGRTSVPSFSGEPYQRWVAGLTFYYAGVSAEVFEALQLDAGGDAVSTIIGLQRFDGSWMNPESLVKEDDPLIATAFAIRALVRTPLLRRDVTDRQRS